MDLTALTGKANITIIHRARVPDALREKALWIVFTDSGEKTGSPGDFSGVDVDAIKVSRSRCDDAKCVTEINERDVLAKIKRTIFLPGVLRDGGGHLAGTHSTGTTIDTTFATLDTFDGTNDRGFVSLGQGGTLAVELTSRIPAGSYIYYGDVGNDNDALKGIELWSITPQLDANGSGVPDVMPLPSHIVKVRDSYLDGATALDLNGDGRPDWFLTGRVNKGPPSREEIDVDRDGKPDIIWTRTETSVTLFADMDHDGNPEYLRRAEHPSSNETLITITRKSVLKPDLKLRIRSLQGMEMLAATLSSDASHSGNFSEIRTWNMPRTQADVTIKTGHFSCEPPFAELVKAGMQAAVRQGESCFNQVSDFYELLLDRFMALATITIDCNYKLKHEAVTHQDLTCDAYLDPRACDVLIELNPNLINPSDIPEIIFHELLHGMQLVEGVTHNNDKPDYDDPFDQVYACEEFCYPKGPLSSLHQSTSSDCNRCLLFAPDSLVRCPKDDCSRAAYCPCNDPSRGKPRIYSSEIECAVKCPSDLKCFATQCTKPPSCSN